jgi:hypothetical protein
MDGYSLVLNAPFAIQLIFGFALSLLFGSDFAATFCVCVGFYLSLPHYLSAEISDEYDYSCDYIDGF